MYEYYYHFYIYYYKYFNIYIYKNFWFKFRLKYLYGDWGLGIGDWAQSPIPNPQSDYYLNVIKIKIFNLNF